MRNPVTHFLDNFGKVPEPRPPLIPGPWRIPFFIALSVVSLVALLLVVNYVVVPAIQVQQAVAPVTAPASPK